MQADVSKTYERGEKRIMAKRRPQERIIEVKSSNEKTVLGLDCSTATIGWGLVTIEETPKLLQYGHIKPMKSDKGSLIERLDDTFSRVQALCNSLGPSVVAVEEIKKFVKGRSSAQTITILAGFNRVISLSAFRCSRDLRYYSEAEVRKIIKSKYFSKSYKMSKEEMPDVVRSHLEPSFQGPLNTKGELAIETYDEADGIVTAWACIIDMQE